MTDEPGRRVAHPIRKGAMLRCTSERENVEPLLEVLNRYENIDSGGIEYQLTCPSHTGYYRYCAEDVKALFVDTGLTNDEVKPIMQSDIRQLYQEVHDHSWHTAVGESLYCPHCRLAIPYPEDDTCPDCENNEYVGLQPADGKEETGLLVCTRHGILTEVKADAA